MPEKENRYYTFFNIQEIKESFVLQLLFCALLLSFFISFYSLNYTNIATQTSAIDKSYVCPPYLENCEKLFFFDTLPYSYSQNILLTFLLFLIGYACYSIYKKDFETAHFCLLLLFLYKIFFYFFLTYGMAGNFDYYDLIFAFIILFFREKEYFAKVTFVFLYFLASTVKIHEGWILGNYFNTLVTGIPIFPDSLTIPITNIVILSQIVGCWFLLINNKKIQTTAYLYFLFFHLYSGLLVGYRYLTISIPVLVILFWIQKSEFKILHIDKKTLFGYLFIVFLFSAQMIAIIIPGDQKKTLEGNFFGLYMFEANHQCISTTTYKYKDGKEEKIINENHVANVRCDPYSYYFRIKHSCNNHKINKIEWTFDHSINGHNYERIVDTQDLCSLSYNSLTHNLWINIENPKILEIPVYKNGFAGELRGVKNELASPVENKFLLNFLTNFYITLWIITLLFILYKVLHSKNYDE